jgi:hypothetical protein
MDGIEILLWMCEKLITLCRNGAFLFCVYAKASEDHLMDGSNGNFSNPIKIGARLTV